MDLAAEISPDSFIRATSAQTPERERPSLRAIAAGPRPGYASRTNLRSSSLQGVPRGFFDMPATGIASSVWTRFSGVRKKGAMPAGTPSRGRRGAYPQVTSAC